MLSWGLLCKSTGICGETQLLTVHSMLFGILYWYVWTILLPRWKGYKLEEETRLLDDGTTVTTMIKVPREQAEGATNLQ
jgi:hypothetical protein